MTNKPNYNVVTPIKRGEGTFWHQIGSAWLLEKSIKIRLNSLPLNGEIHLFEPDDNHKER